MIYLHPATQAMVEAYNDNLPHALILSGPVGVGLTAVAQKFVQQHKGIATTVMPKKNETEDLEKGVITVESIRTLYDQTKTVGKQPRFVVIDYAERMGSGAQNAFLKLLEEPPRNTHFLLLTHEPGRLLPTIRSRAQHVEVRPITTQQSEKMLDALKVHDATKRSQLLFIASGLPAELSRIINDSKMFEKRAQLVRDARALVQGRRYEGLVIAQRYKDDRQASLFLLEDAMKLLRRSAVQQPDATQVLAKINTLIKTYDRIKANGNVRLQLAASVI